MKKFVFSILKMLRKSVSGKEEIFRRFPLVLKIFNFFYKLVGPKGIILTEVQGHKMFTDAKASGFVLTGCWEKNETEIFKKIVKNGMNVIDIGAHIGYYTLIAAKIVGAKGKIYAFEPEQKNYSLLTKNIEINKYKNIISARKAVSNKTGTTKLFLQTSALHTIVNPHGDKKSVDVETIALDDFFTENQKIDFIKMDAEGAEYMIFQGMANILKNNYNLIILTEFYPKLLKEYIDPRMYLDKFIKNNFKIFLISNKKIKPVNINYLINQASKKSKDYSVNLLCSRRELKDIYPII